MFETSYYFISSAVNLLLTGDEKIPNSKPCNFAGIVRLGTLTLKNVRCERKIFLQIINMAENNMQLFKLHCTAISKLQSNQAHNNYNARLTAGLNYTIEKSIGEEILV